MATSVKTPSGTWKALIRKQGWPTTSKTFRTKRDAEDWSRRTEDEMDRGVFITRSPSERTTFEAALKRYTSAIDNLHDHGVAQKFWVAYCEIAEAPNKFEAVMCSVEGI